MCKVSIIVPVYNKKKYLDCVLENIQQQEFDDFECILVDDGSTDKTKEIVQWCNGSTSDSGSACEGSSPSWTT